MKYFSVVVVVLVFLSCIQHVEAASFSQAYVRFDRMKASTATTGLVCVKPATNSTENDLQITFPTGFSVSGSTSNWTVSTTNLPPGGSAWPGISTASSVSGNTVTFPSSDLSVGTLYCFRWTNSSAITTAANGDYEGTIKTRDASTATIDSSNFGISTTSNDQVNVTATVVPNASDVSFALTADQADGSTLTNGQQVMFTITYRSLGSSSFPFTITADWERGLITGSSSNYIDMFDYVVGSATTSPEGAVPVVDTTNRTITWDISNLSPSATASTVTFKLQARTDFDYGQTATAHVSASGETFNTTLAQSQLSFSTNGSITPTPTPTATNTPTPTPTGSASNPTATPGPNATSTPTPTPTIIIATSKPFRIDSVKIAEILDSSVQIEVKTSTLSTLEVMYGTKPDNLAEHVTVDKLKTEHLVILNNLEKNTRYYFKVKATNTSHTTLLSDIFTFKTASTSTKLDIKDEDIVISADRTTLTPFIDKSISLPYRLPILFQLHINNPQDISELTIKFRDKQVLGISTFLPLPAIEEVRLLEVIPKFFSGTLLSPEKKGEYEVVLEVKDINGNYYTQVMPYTVHIVDPITVLDDSTREPIEHAKVEILKYEPTTKQYTDMTQILALPHFTDEKGQLLIALPNGKYIFEITSEGYKKNQLNFDIDETHYEYPTIYLKSPYGFFGLSYIISSLNLTTLFFKNTLDNFFVSKIANDATLFLFEIILIILTIFTSSMRLHIGPFGLLSHLFSLPLTLVKDAIFSHNRQKLYVHNIVSAKPIVGAKVYITNDKNHVILHGKTDLLGQFFLLQKELHGLKNYKILIEHKKYKPVSITIDSDKAIRSNSIDIGMQRLIIKPSTTLEVLGVIGNQVIFFIYDLTIVMAFAMSLLFTLYQGIHHTYPVLIITGLLFLLWFVYIQTFLFRRKSV